MRLINMQARRLFSLNKTLKKKHPKNTQSTKSTLNGNHTNDFSNMSFIVIKGLALFLTSFAFGRILAYSFNYNKEQNSELDPELAEILRSIENGKKDFRYPVAESSKNNNAINHSNSASLK